MAVIIHKGVVIVIIIIILTNVFHYGKDNRDWSNDCKRHCPEPQCPTYDNDDGDDVDDDDDDYVGDDYDDYYYDFDDEDG